MDLMEKGVNKAGHGGLGRLCKICKKMKNLEGSLIMKIGCFFHPGGLNKRDINFVFMLITLSVLLFFELPRLIQSLGNIYYVPLK